MFRTTRKLPMFRLLALAQVGLLARRHLAALNGQERRRLMELGRRPHRLSAKERAELKRLAAKLEPRAFAEGAVRTVSPFDRRGRRR
jgi:hypothetical protein